MGERPMPDIKAALEVASGKDPINERHCIFARLIPDHVMRIDMPGTLTSLLIVGGKDHGVSEFACVTWSMHGEYAEVVFTATAIMPLRELRHMRIAESNVTSPGYLYYPDLDGIAACLSLIRKIVDGHVRCRGCSSWYEDILEDGDEWCGECDVPPHVMGASDG